METSNYDSEGTGVPQRREVKHYHGDTTRALFVAAAILLIVAKSTGADLPLTTTGTVMSAILLVIAAGIINPAEGWIHWFNAIIAVCGTLLFGITAIHKYSDHVSFTDSSFIYVEALTLLSLVALYLTTKTIRGYQQRPVLS